MKKSFKGILVLAFALLMFFPLTLFADENAYELFDFKFDKVIGANIKNTTVTIYASMSDDKNNLTDRTSEFNVVEKMWSVCTDATCSLAEEVADDAVFEEGKSYVFMIRINAVNGADINVWGTDGAKLNGTPIENLDGEYGNTGTELMIKSKVVEAKDSDPEPTSEPTPEPEPTTGPTPAPDNKTEESCMLGLSLCCTTFLGLSICIWILIAIILLIVLIALIVVKSKKKTEEQPQEPQAPSNPNQPVQQ